MRQELIKACVTIGIILCSMPAQAGIGNRAIREAVEFATRKFGKEVAEEGVETLTAKMVRFAGKYGDEVVAGAVKKVGPRAGRIAGEAGEHGGTALRLLAKHGDDALGIAVKKTSLKTVEQYGDNAATALIKHGSVGERLIESFGKEGVEALARVTPQNGRRLAMLAADDALKPELLPIVTNYGDTACDFIWRHKGALAVGTTLTAFVASPGEFIDGTKDLAAVAADAVLKPLAEVPQTVAAEAAKHVNWTLVSIVTVLAAGGVMCFRIALKRLSLRSLIRS